MKLTVTVSHFSPNSSKLVLFILCCEKRFTKEHIGYQIQALLPMWSRLLINTNMHGTSNNYWIALTHAHPHKHSHINTYKHAHGGENFAHPQYTFKHRQKIQLLVYYCTVLAYILFSVILSLPYPWHMQRWCWNTSAVNPTCLWERG